MVDPSKDAGKQHIGSNPAGLDADPKKAMITDFKKMQEALLNEFAQNAG
jgi:hypothetical protein